MSNTGYAQWLRKYRLLIVPKSGGNAIDVSQLRITFICEKSTTETPNFSQITVYNLAGSTIASIKAGDKVILEAGYQNGNCGMIFTGEIVQPYTSNSDNTDIALTLIVQDGDAYLNSAFTAQTIGKKATPKDILSACSAGSEGLGTISKLLPQTKLPRGKVLFGKSAYYVKQIARTTRGQFYVEDGKVNIVAAPDYDPSTAVELNPSTGLIGIPSQTDDGVSGQCLLNPSIKLNTLIYINASLVSAKAATKGEDGAVKVSDKNSDGVYRVVKLTYEGDTYGDPWYCNFEAVTQAGAKLTAQEKDVVSPWR